MADLNSDTVLQLAPSLKVELGARTLIHLEAPVNQSITTGMPPHEIRSWPQLSEPGLLADVDPSGTRHPIINEASEFSITRDGLMSGFLLYFDLDVGAGQEISTSPARADETSSWAVMIRLFAKPRPVKEGEKFKVTYRYRVEHSVSKIELLPA